MSQENKHDTILVFDFGSQYTQLIARRLREIGVYSEIVHSDLDRESFEKYAPKGVILSGGPESVTASDTPRIPDYIFDLNIPVLGICYGLQAMAAQLGGSVASSAFSEFGHTEVMVTEADDPLFDGIQFLESDGKDSLDVWMSHGDHVSTVPAGFRITAKNNETPVIGMSYVDKQLFGIQFHPEVTHTKQGKAILTNFVCGICKCKADWTSKNIIEESVAQIKAQVGDDEVLVALSGGVDSAVTAAMVHRAVGDRLTCLFVDTGLLRKGEGDAVMQAFEQHLGVKVIRINAADDFLKPLAGVSDPEQKRKICGEAFIRVFERESKRLKGIKWLGQGTIYPDVIESAGTKNGKAHVIKSHHNVGGLPDDMPFELVEPLRNLFKDEVRRVGLELGLSPALLFRHPFPGPGLAVRILGEIKPEYVSILQEADHIFMSALREYDLYDKTSQAFAVFLPVKSVGVKGDARCYEYVIALRAVETVDFMTAHYAELPHKFLADVGNRIMNQVSRVSRVVYDISSKPPATIEWE